MKSVLMALLVVLTAASAPASVLLHIPVLRTFSDGGIFYLSAYQDLNSYAGAPITGINMMAKNLQSNAPGELSFSLGGAPMGPPVDVLNYRIYSLFPSGNAMIPKAPVAATALQMQVRGQVQVDWVDIVVGP